VQVSGWLLHKTEAMGTLASQADIDVWVQASGELVEIRGYDPWKNFSIVYAKSCILVHFWHS